MAIKRRPYGSDMWLVSRWTMEGHLPAVIVF